MSTRLLTVVVAMFLSLASSITPAFAKAGALDTGFSGDGKVEIPIVPYCEDILESVAIQDDGKILAVGHRYNEDTGFSGTMLFRFLADGSPDPLFGAGSGFEWVSMGGPSQGYDVTLLPDDRIAVVGSADVDPDNVNWDMALAVLNPDGSPDTTFSGDGVVTVARPEGQAAYAIAIDADGRFLLAGGDFTVGGQFEVLRLDSAGVLDPSFSGDGVQRAKGWSRAYDIALQDDGRIVAVGGQLSTRRFAVARFLDDGSLDATFSDDGEAYAPKGRYTYEAQGVAIQSNGRIVAVGGGNDILLARFRADGRLDPRFNNDGLVRTDAGSDDDQGRDLVIDPLGRIVAVGIESTSTAVTVRYSSSGRLDKTFSGDGISRVGNTWPGAMGTAIDATGNVYLVGGHLLARYLGV